MEIKQPDRGFIFWPVGTGDSTTIRIDETVYLQLDLRHMTKSEDDDDPAYAVIDELTEILPTLDGKPFLSTFILTHPDLDHCQGFEKLNDEMVISEIWMSPRTFQEYQNNEDLCDDAEAFYKESMRRVKATINAKGDPGRGNRIRIIGYDHLLKQQEFSGFPEEFFSVPGHTITVVDGEELSDKFSAFVHAPFKDDSYGDRNDCSLAFQVSLMSGTGIIKALLMGDLTYPIIRRIFNSSDKDTLSWNILLAPHHCSKSVFYWKDESDEEEVRKKDIVQDFSNNALSTSYVISSSRPIPAKDEPNANPPHAKAKAEYLRLGPNEFFCTHEHPNEKSPAPIIFEVTGEGISYLGDTQESNSLEEGIKAAAGSGAAPTSAVGFGFDIK